MKRQTLLLLTVAALACSSTSYADIISAQWGDDGDGAIVCGNNWNWNANTATLSMRGDQYGWPGLPGEPAHMNGTINTSGLLDPTLTLSSAVNNDTGVAWVGYQVNVIMGVPFSFGSSTPTVANYPYPTPSGWTPDWTLTSVVAPTYQTSGQYEGTLYFSGGTPVQPGDELDFSYAISFKNSLQYSFTQEMIPVLVPEPSSLSLLAIGGLLCAGLRSRRPRS